MKKVYIQVRKIFTYEAVRLLKEEKLVHLVDGRPNTTLKTNILVWYTTDKQLETINSIINDLNNA